MGIYIALGANLPSERHGSPRETLEAALDRLTKNGVTIVSTSPWYVTAPVPRSDQPDYVNAVAAVATELGPSHLLALLHETEAAFGRTRKARNEARAIDLDLVAYHQLVSEDGSLPPQLPHPRMHQRAFVLVPLRDVAPAWRHPRLRKSVDELIAGLPRPWGLRPL